jgi:predicted CxxxxCH...CXXCH cytochrome family protein
LSRQPEGVENLRALSQIEKGGTDMPRLAFLLSLFFLVLIVGGCADDNSSAPETNQPHLMGAQWLLPEAHPAAAIDNSPPCFQCHQETGGPIEPSCSTCHTAGSPNFVLGTCDSCHAKPPDGTVRPNRAGAHAVHNGLKNVTNVCNTCHNGAGSGTLKHYDTSAPADVAVLSAYNAKTGQATFTPDAANPGTGTCSNVSCHGGQQTPDWQTGTLNVNQDCTSCHQLGTAFQTPQYNSPYSGQHQFHVENRGFACTICHDTTKLAASHFIGLDTPDFEGDPATTLRDFLNFDPQASTCTNNNAACHQGETRTW